MNKKIDDADTGDDNNNNNNDEDDTLLFRPIPPARGLSHIRVGKQMKTYESCCGKYLCRSCSEEATRVTEEKGTLSTLCFLQSTPTPTSEKELVLRLEKRKYGLPQDPRKGS
mmetsp:Transcript_19649/g.22122  ORF Transcript_19649/g.22122 Transcript_19649/m.22122 type:complete len:112 (-) Transcript_19649:9-344(-)